MKKMFALLLALSLIFCLAACSEDTPTDPEPTDPATRTYYLLLTQETTLANGSKTKLEYHFNENNFPEYALEDNGSGTVLRRDFTCDEYGNLIGWTQTGDDSSLSVQHVRNAMGLIEETTVTQNGQQTTHTKYTYNEKGKLLSVVNTNTFNGESYQFRTEYHYDENGFENGQTSYYNGAKESYAEISNDLDGKPLTVHYYDANGNLTQAIYFLYSGNTTTVTADLGNGTNLYRQIIYKDENGNVVRMEYISDQSTSYTIVNTYKAIEIPFHSIRQNMN